MKRIFCIFLCLCLFSALLAGCTSTSEESSVVESSVESSTAESSVESVVESSEESTSETETTETASEEDTSSEESTVVELYDWDCNKGWPVYVGEYVTTGEERVYPYGSSEWWYTARAFKALGTELLFLVSIYPSVAEGADGASNIGDDAEYEMCLEFMTGLDIPLFMSTVEIEYFSSVVGYCAALSYDDVVHLSELAEQQGITIRVDVCKTLDPWDDYDTAAPEIPENWLELAESF